MRIRTGDGGSASLGGRWTSGLCRSLPQGTRGDAWGPVSTSPASPEILGWIAGVVHPGKFPGVCLADGASAVGRLGR